MLYRKDETDYFELNNFAETYKLTHEEITTLSEQIATELTKMEWKVGFNFGHTGMFIYANEPPHNLYPDGFE